MEYKGKLYGHLGGKMYLDTGKTADDLDALEKRVSELEAENKALRQPLVSGSLSQSCFVNIYEDEQGKFISDTEYSSWDSAFDNRDKLKSYFETVEIRRRQ